VDLVPRFLAAAGTAAKDQDGPLQWGNALRGGSPGHTARLYQRNSKSTPVRLSHRRVWNIRITVLKKGTCPLSFI